MMKRPRKDIFFVLIQICLFGLYAFFPRVVDIMLPSWLQMAGLALTGIGCLIMLVAFLQLNTNLSPFPSPKSSGEHIQTGIYAYIRHPIYTGILLLTVGYGLYGVHTIRLIVAALLWILFSLKARYEEQLLLERFDSYEAYMNRVGRFLPKIAL